MDWFAWLSRSNLDPCLVYEYGLTFARNELEKEDLTNFDHEFLQSMGISVAKHRLEILKLVGAGAGGGPKTKSLSKLISAAFKETRKNIAKRIHKLIFQEEVESSIKTLPAPVLETTRYQVQDQEQWRRALWTGKYKSEQKEKPATTLQTRTRRGIAKSGPLDGRVAVAQETKMMLTNSSLKFSGPLDRSMQERLLFTYRSPLSSGPLDARYYANKSPTLSGPLDARPPSPRVYPHNIDYSKEKLVDGRYDDHKLWAALFQDLKPT